MESILDFFNEIEKNYGKKHAEALQNGKYVGKKGLTKSWPYIMDLLKEPKRFLKINKPAFHLSINCDGGPISPLSIGRFGIFILPKKHKISQGVYLMIRKNEDIISCSLVCSDKSSPSEQVQKKVETINESLKREFNENDASIDNSIKGIIQKFYDLSKSEKFPNMLTKNGAAWNEEYRFNEEIETAQTDQRNSKSLPKSKGHIPLNQILYGPPGTGKTYKTIDISTAIVESANVDIEEIINTEDKAKHDENAVSFNEHLKKEMIHFITFHQNYSYEEFVGGIRPKDNKEGKLQFEWKPGIFVKACSKALQLACIEPDLDEYNGENNREDWFFDKCKNYNEVDYKYGQKIEIPKVVLIIDEINRANISRVFGELITLIEDDKRIGGVHRLILSLPNGKKFGVPKNLIIIGTMNTADKSLALLDVALRRRFEFIGLFPQKNLIEEKYQQDFEKINNNIREDKSINYQIGHSYFMSDNLDRVINNKVLPLLNEYYMEDSKKIKSVFDGTRWGPHIEPENGILKYKYDSKYKKDEETDNQNN